jgi:hypothetical protein
MATRHIESIEALKGLEDLKNLDLVGNPVAELKDYREKIFEMFPELFVLDNVT